MCDRRGIRPSFVVWPVEPAAVESVTPSWGQCMLRYAMIFLVLALIAGVFGFGGVSSASAGIAKILFFLFLVIFLVTLVTGSFGGRRSTGG